MASTTHDECNDISSRQARGALGLLCARNPAGSDREGICTLLRPPLREEELGVNVCPQGEGGEGRRVMAEALPLLENRGAEASDDGEGPEG